MVQWKMIPTGTKAGGCDYCSSDYAEFITGETVRTVIKDDDGNRARTKRGVDRLKTRDKRICDTCLRKQFPQKDNAQWAAFLTEQRDLVERARARGLKARAIEAKGFFLDEEGTEQYSLE